MFGFYETPARLRAKADRIVPALGPLFDSGAVELLWQTPTSDLLDAYGKALMDAVHRRRAKRLFIDGLTAFRSGAVDPSRVGNFFSGLHTYGWCGPTRSRFGRCQTLVPHTR
jgi:circadian clock protein KaiC